MSELNFLERFQAALANTETLPDINGMKDAAEGDTELGTVPPALQGLLTLHDELVEDHNNVASKASKGEFDGKSVEDVRRELKQLSNFVDQASALFWTLCNDHFNVDKTKNGAVAVRKGWRYVTATVEPTSLDEMLRMAGAPEGIMVTVVGGPGMGRPGGLGELLDRLHRG